MKSKIERIRISTENIEQGIQYFIQDARNRLVSGRFSRRDYYQLEKNLGIIRSSLEKLKFEKNVEPDDLLRIRLLHLSIMPFYEEGDNNILFSEFIRYMNQTFADDKERDRQILGNFKMAFNRLSNYYQYRIRKVDVHSSKDICFQDRNFDNVQCIIDYYLSAKYNIKKVKYDTASISSVHQYLIDECTKVVVSDEYDDEIKEIYSRIRGYITKYARAEIVINALYKISDLCTKPEFAGIQEKTGMLLDKYNQIYDENHDKYELEKEKIASKLKRHQELERLLQSIDLEEIVPEDQSISSTDDVKIFQKNK